ncbi:hypothetical protein L596_027361 [Steinernema carpocapsae]|uniref:acid phosphatase n=1 Tax=Steinernema carpocapsae TaxID=34508 RepID=A0A4U5M434_STECR|nr:hypothetical protein L596_027361 [Steinernema carpocapsae]
MRLLLSVLVGLFALADLILAKDKLVLLQAAWRHGDRSPTRGFPKDIYKESDWHWGWGQLNAKGMEQHLELGQKLRQHYLIEKDQFDFDMKPSYVDSHEIYIRSTDVNRTIISAMSNMIGFYDTMNNATYTAGEDYPKNDAWPAGFVPIAIHTVTPFEDDHVGHPSADCQLQTDLWQVITESQLYKNKTQELHDFFTALTKNTGEKIGLDHSLQRVADNLFIQQYNGFKLADWVKEVGYEKIHAVADLLNSWENGEDLGNLTVNGQDVFTLIRQCRGGSLVWNMLNHMQSKKNCLAAQASKDPKKSKQCKFMDPLKYYVYSAHDTTLDALLTALGSVKKVLGDKGEYPHFSAAVTMELLEAEDKKFYVRANYFHPNHNYTAFAFTKFLHGCEKTTTTDDKCLIDDVLKSMEFLLPPKGETIDSYCSKGLDQFKKGISDSGKKSGSQFTTSFGLMVIVLALFALKQH